MRRIPASWTAGVEKLKSGKGPCCDGSNSAHVEPSDWETLNKPRSHYKIRLDGVWADVPDEAVVTEPIGDGCSLPSSGTTTVGPVTAAYPTK